jgi:N-methylhydantoinase A
MPAPPASQTELVVGVDVGGTFTDLVASDGRSLQIVKVPSTPGAFHQGVIDAVSRVLHTDTAAATRLVHGSTVATNALLQRAGSPIAFLTTEGFADTLLIGRQNRPRLYALRVERPAPITDHCFGLPERIAADGTIVTPLDEPAVHRAIDEIRRRDLRHVAVCLLFSFVNPVHERRVGQLCEAAGLTVSLSSDLLPEFREYERASTTAINASLRPTVETYLTALHDGLRAGHRSLQIIHSSGGTLSPADAARQAARLVLSGPAGGILGAAHVAALAGFPDVITYDMGGTSTDVATIVGGQPQWTTTTTIDGLPIALPMFDIHTVGAGGGSIAYVDTGGALRVGPRSAGATPGPACYDRGGAEPTVTDANLLLGRILPEAFLGGAMAVRPDLAGAAIGRLAQSLGKTPIKTALGVVKVAEANMEAAIRAVTSRRGHDPRSFALVSFGGAGGLHACAIAQSLDVPRVLIPPCAGVLSALGMVVAPPVAEASKTVVHLGDALDDARLAAEFGQISGRTMDTVPYDQTTAVEAWADLRFKGQSHELKVRATRPTLEEIHGRFLEAYAQVYGRTPSGRPIEVVTLRVRRVGRSAGVALPEVAATGADAGGRSAPVVLEGGGRADAPVHTRATLLRAGPGVGPLLLIDAEATAYVPPGWRAEARANGTVLLTRGSGGA